MLHKYSFLPNFKISFFLAIAGLLLFSCNKFDGDQTIPSYIHIDKINLIDNPAINEGSLSNKITDAWVYVDDELIGAFELPATFPVLKKGNHKISIYPGIKLNGISGTRVQYDFYKKISISDSILVEGNTTQLDTLYTSYKDESLINIWKEDFESSSINFQKRALSDTSISIIQTFNPANLFDVSPAGIVTIGPNQTKFEVEPRGDNFIFPKSSSPVFLEMNYKTNNTVYVGLLVYQTNQTIPSNQVSTIALRPTTEWKKIYINFTPDINDYYNASSYKFFIGAAKDAGVQTAEILFDNIKLVYFKTAK
ncbi:MAG: hypothetical protein ACOYO1_03710 [Bacteroidales bacterium]